MLFLIDKPMAEVAFRTVASYPDADIILMQDGVFLEPDEHIYNSYEGNIYAIERDVSVRGVTLPADVEPIGYETFVEKCLEQEVKTFA